MLAQTSRPVRTASVATQIRNLRANVRAHRWDATVLDQEIARINETGDGVERLDKLERSALECLYAAERVEREIAALRGQR